MEEFYLKINKKLVIQKYIKIVKNYLLKGKKYLCMIKQKKWSKGKVFKSVSWTTYLIDVEYLTFYI